MPYIDRYPDTQLVTKSHYKLWCHICQNQIKKGSEITQMVEYGGDSMTLRCRTVKSSTGGVNCFYTPETGARWVHKNCIPRWGWTNYSGWLYNKEYYS